MFPCPKSFINLSDHRLRVAFLKFMIPVFVGAQDNCTCNIMIQRELRTHLRQLQSIVRLDQHLSFGIRKWFESQVQSFCLQLKAIQPQCSDDEK